jgi:hypothetical protein
VHKVTWFELILSAQQKQEHGAQGCVNAHKYPHTSRIQVPVKAAKTCAITLQASPSALIPQTASGMVCFAMLSWIQAWKSELAHTGNGNGRTPLHVTFMAGAGAGLPAGRMSTMR